MPHLVFTLFTALLLSLAMAVIENRSRRERLIAGARCFLYCAAATAGGSWLMHLIHG